MLLAVILRKTIRSLVNYDARHFWKRRLDPMPNPNRDILRRRILKPLDIVEAVVIELGKQRSEPRFDL